jgi:signal peptidase II
MKKQIFKLLILSSFMISGCTADLQTKNIINTELKGQSVAVIQNFFNLTYVENHAIAFGLFNNVEKSIRMPIIFALPILTTLLCLFFIWKIRKSKFRLLLPVFIILGGAYGNILDRAMNGFVTDFLHLHYFHKYNFYVFNVADVLVNIGLILILFQYKEFNKLLNTVFTKRTELERR